MEEILLCGKNVVQTEIEALERLKSGLNSNFLDVLDKIFECEGRIIITGVGKSGHIAGKIAATMSSLGKPAFCIHPDDALHGDLGMITPNDVVIMISNSGESDELVMALPNLKAIGAYLIAMTSNEHSRLARGVDLLCLLPKTNEACVLNMAPTSSTTTALVYGDALCVALSQKLQFTRSDFAKFHPAGALGKKLAMTVESLMHLVEEEKISIFSGALLKEAVLQIGANRAGAVVVVDSCNVLCGIITNGDIRRVVEKDKDIYSLTVDEVMTKTPITIQKGTLAIDALILMKDKGINASVLPVLDGKTVLGIVTIYDIMKAGISE